MVDDDGAAVAAFPKQDWNLIADFFAEIVSPQILL